MEKNNQVNEKMALNNSMTGLSRQVYLEM